MLITQQSDLESFCASLKEVPFITVDTEFLREKTYYPKLCLVQVCGPDIAKAAAIDVIENPDLDLAPLFNLFFDKSILKIFHAGRQDLEILFNLTGRVVEPFFDTQIAAMVCGYGDSVGYEALVRNVLNAQLDKSSQFTDWSKRPLSDRQLTYALGDVTHLVKIYEKLEEELEQRGRTSWVFEEEETLADPATYKNDPYESWKRVKMRSPKPKTLALLRELAAWREKRAQHKNLPKNWVMRDETLADMASQAPKNAKALSKIRNMSGDVAKGRHGEALLKIIAEVEQSDPASWPKVPKKRGLPSEASAKLDALKMLLKIQCAQHEVATKLVVNKEDMDNLALGRDEDLRVMKGWRYEMFGKYVEELKNGKLAIGMNGKKIVKYKVADNTEIYD